MCQSCSQTSWPGRGGLHSLSSPISPEIRAQESAHESDATPSAGHNDCTLVSLHHTWRARSPARPLACPLARSLARSTPSRWTVSSATLCQVAIDPWRPMRDECAETPFSSVHRSSFAPHAGHCSTQTNEPTPKGRHTDGNHNDRSCLVAPAGFRVGPNFSRLKTSSLNMACQCLAAPSDVHHHRGQGLWWLSDPLVSGCCALGVQTG